MTFTASNTDIINLLSITRGFARLNRHEVAFVAARNIGQAARLLEDSLYNYNINFKADPAGWVNVYDGGTLVGTLEGP
jgi:hypothetical protein